MLFVHDRKIDKIIHIAEMLKAVIYFHKKFHLTYVNLSKPAVHWKVTETQANLQLQATPLFKYVWPFSANQALKGLPICPQLQYFTK